MEVVMIQFDTKRDTVSQISDMVNELKLNRFQKQFLMSIMSWGIRHTITEKQKAAVLKIANKVNNKVRCEDAGCCGCCR
jgi:hypothetical protein